MSRPIIAVDLDDTLAQHFALLADWHNAQYGSRLTLQDNHPFSQKHWATPELRAATLNRWGADSVDRAVKRVQQYFTTEQFINAPVLGGAVAVVTELAKRFTVVVVTARDVHLEEMTRDWLDRNFGAAISDVHLTARFSLEGKARDKVAVLTEVGAFYLIDDDTDVCNRAAQAGVGAILFGDYPWQDNQPVDAPVRRCKDWPAVVEYLQDESIS